MSLLTTIDFKTISIHLPAKWQELIQIPWYLRIWEKVWKMWLKCSISSTLFLSLKAPKISSYKPNSWGKIHFFFLHMHMIFNQLEPSGDCYIYKYKIKWLLQLFLFSMMCNTFFSWLELIAIHPCSLM